MQLVDALRRGHTLLPCSQTEADWWCQAGAALDGLRGNGSAQPPLVRRASTALVLRQREGRSEVVIIKRRHHPSDKWSGHLALPGGKQDDGENDLQTAVRETREEVGLEIMPNCYQLLGKLPERKVVGKRCSKLIISTFVFIELEAGRKLTPNPGEVAAAWWVDTEFFFPHARVDWIGFPLRKYRPRAGLQPWRALVCLLGAGEVYFPCFYLRPPLAIGDSIGDFSRSPLQREVLTTDSSCSAKVWQREFALWGITFNLFSDLALCCGRLGYAYSPAFFPVSNPILNVAIRAYYWAAARFGVSSRPRLARLTRANHHDK